MTNSLPIQHRTLGVRCDASGDLPTPNATARSTASLRSSFSWMLAGNVIYAACQWGILSLMARLGTPAIVGQFVFALALTAPVMSLFLLQTRAIQATDARQQFQYGHYLALRLVSLGLALVTVLGISLWAQVHGNMLAIILAVAFSSSMDGLSDTAYGLLQQHERLDGIARSMMLRGVCGLAALGMTMFFTRSLGWAILAGAGMRALIFCGFDLINVRKILRETQADWRPLWDPKALWTLTVLAAPLGLVMMLVVLNNSLPRFFVERHLDAASLGVFGAIGYLSVVGTMIVGALGESATPRLARAFAIRNRAEFLRLTLRLVGIGAGLGLAAVSVAAVAGPQILALLYGPDYAAQNTLFIWMMAAAAVGYMASFCGYAVTAARFFRVQLPLFVVVVMTNAAGCWWLVPTWGLPGAAMALLISSGVQLSGTLLILGVGLAFQTDGQVRPPTEAV